ncbi:MarR family winged helix-turn-helix transcriptional regulator [Pseudonocardia kunmingensis]|uniref:DNA-binding MarR family transcriptional regulator n=1 Tax=Pseudonocardia kunmingensis TaxID=630975 RepID=A0A543CXB0_9PSEU|nr:MarR family transcriptional regulator [Pseudonocardia kunmingensis]TQM01679.1 DNA-binding MarR family transcriptional regulator [Pseudonocardia kunmingensis]
MRSETTDVVHAARALHAATEALLDAVASRYGVNRNDLRCLEILEREGPMTAGGLAAASHLSPAAITKVVDRLDRAGYVTRHPDAEDRRAHIVGTSDGHADLRTAIWQPVLADAEAAFGARPAAELCGLAEDLRRLGELNRTHARRLSEGRTDPSDQ